MYSLRRRLLIIATLLLLVFLGIIGYGLNRAFESSVQSAAQDSLRNQILLLIAAVDVVDGQVIAPDVLSEPRLQQADSNLFAQIYSLNDRQVPTMLWRSPSLLERELPVQAGGLGDFEFTGAVKWSELNINTMVLAVEWETDGGNVPFVIQVAESNQAYLARLHRYQRQVGVWLLFFGGALVLLLLGFLSWSLKPLERMRKQVSEIEQGQRMRFDEDYPVEVSRLTQNLNQLLSYEEQRIEKQKEVLGNLAHSLKTPIAILKGLKYSSEVKLESEEQLSAMQTIIDYQLQSASAVGRRRFAKGIKIEEISQQIVRSLEKLHANKHLTVKCTIDPEVLFYGEQGDWMELMGNLCDNAFKWAASNVIIHVEQVDLGQHASQKKPIKLSVQDDGVGIDRDQRDVILQRGVRLDSQTPGHGLGMSIVKNIVDAYDGDINIGDSSFNTGAKFDVVLM